METISKLIDKQATIPKPVPESKSVLPAFYPPGLYQKPTAFPIEEAYQNYAKPEKTMQFPKLIAPETTSEYSQYERYPVTQLFTPSQAVQPEAFYTPPVSQQYQVIY